MSAHTLAYIGDAVLEVLVRDYVILEMKVVKQNMLQKASIDFVSAKAQAAFVDYALVNDIFTEEEVNYYRRGKNAKETRTLKNARPLDHRKSTGFEAVLGFLHLQKNETRLTQLFDIYEQFVRQNKEKDGIE